MNQAVNSTHAKPGASHFDSGASEWDQRPTSQQLIVVPPRLIERVQFSKSDAVLDFGAGTGLLATAIAPQVARVTALDTSAPMLQVLSEKGFANITTQLGEAPALAAQMPGAFDAIVSCMVLHHVPDTAGLMRAFAQLLRGAGRVALVDLYAEDGTFHGTPEDNRAKGVAHHGFEPEALRALAIDAGLEHIEFQPIAEIQQRNGRAYPLFLMTGFKRS